MGGNINDSIQRKAFIFNVQKYNTYDGPGVRTIVFFKGCPLRCKWCSNPEGLERKFQVMYAKNVCVNCGACVSVCPVKIHGMDENGNHTVQRNIECIGCRACEKACAYSALSIVGELKNISELVEVIEKDKMFYDVSGGGITLSGGEVLSQPEAAANLLMACKYEGINTAVETSGYAKPANLLKVAEFTDLFLYDLKHMDSDTHFQFTGVHNEIILDNFKELIERRYNVLVRVPLIRGVNDDFINIDMMVKFLLPFKELKNFKGVHILPYHKMGVGKYNKLDLDYTMFEAKSFSDVELEDIATRIRLSGIKVSVIKH